MGLLTEVTNGGDEEGGRRERERESCICTETGEKGKEKKRQGRIQRMYSIWKSYPIWPPRLAS